MLPPRRKLMTGVIHPDGVQVIAQGSYDYANMTEHWTVKLLGTPSEQEYVFAFDVKDSELLKDSDTVLHRATDAANILLTDYQDAQAKGGDAK